MRSLIMMWSRLPANQNLDWRCSVGFAVNVLAEIDCAGAAYAILGSPKLACVQTQHFRFEPMSHTLNETADGPRA